MLEVRIEELTKAIRDLIDVIHNQRALTYQDAVKPLPSGSPERTAENIQREIDEAKAPNASTKSEPTPDTSPTSLTESKPVTYEDVKRITIAVSAKDKPKAVAALARFGVTSAKGLKEGQWGEYVAYMQKVAAGEVDPEASE